MSGGAHGRHPDEHEHVRCPWCLANGVHLDSDPQRWGGSPGDAYFGPHNRKGSTMPCIKSRGRVVPAEHRHRRDPS